MEKKHWINVRDKPAFLLEVMRYLAGDDAQIYFEGDLTDCDFTSIENLDLSCELFVCDKGASFVVLPLKNENIKAITKQILPYARIIHKIRHILIQKKEKIQLMVGDNFHNECISSGPLLTEDLLSKLKITGIVRNYHPS